MTASVALSNDTIKTMLRYFDFHPAPQMSKSAPKAHGIIPVWGFGTVVVLTVSKIQVKEHIFGYLGMACYLLLPIDVMEINNFNL